MMPSTDYDGKVYLEGKSHISLSPNGNGGWFKSLLAAGIAQKYKAAGVEWINVFAVDNVCQRMADPVFVGATIKSGKAIGAKVIAKAAPDEHVGVMCLRNGHPSIVEYYEMTPELMEAKDERGEPAYNFGVILNYLFRIADLEKTLSESFPVHVVEKKIAYMGPGGETISPAEPNGYKFELLMIDQIRSLPTCLPSSTGATRATASSVQTLSPIPLP